MRGSAHRVAFAGLLASALLSVAAAGPAADPAAEIRLPGAPVVPQPMPGPDAADKLAGDSLFVIDSDVPVLVLVSPAGFVSVTEEAGPLKFRGRFVDGTGVETRTFKGKAVFTVEPVRTGRVEILVVPVGAAKADQVIRRTVEVDAGQGPQPPPKPVDPKVEPKPDSPIAAPGLHVLIRYDAKAAMPPAQQAILDGKAARDWLEANCVAGPDGKTRQYRIWPADVDGYAESRLWGDAQKRPAAALPWLLVSNGTTGYEGPLPADVEKFLALVAKYK